MYKKFMIPKWNQKSFAYNATYIKNTCISNYFKIFFADVFIFFFQFRFKLIKQKNIATLTYMSNVKLYL